MLQLISLEGGERGEHAGAWEPRENNDGFKGEIMAKYNLVTRSIQFDRETGRITSDALHGNQVTGTVIASRGQEYFVPAKWVGGDGGLVPVVDERAVDELRAELDDE